MTNLTSLLRLGWSAVLLLALLGRSAVAQAPGGPNLATRAELESALARLQGKRGSEAQGKMMRERLENGDFRAGDRIFVWVAGDRELSDTFTVTEGPELPLSQLGAVSLHGVLRSELAPLVYDFLRQYIRDPVVQVQPLIRIMVAGDVQRPGYYALSPDLPLVDAINAAGGLTARADVDEMRVERGGAEIWGGRWLQQEMGRGSSIDQLNLQAGDRLMVPARGPSMAHTLGVLLITVPAVIYTITLINW